MFECFFFPVFLVPNVKSIYPYFEIYQIIIATRSVIDKYFFKYDIRVSMTRSILQEHPKLEVMTTKSLKIISYSHYINMRRLELIVRRTFKFLLPSAYR